MGLLDGLINTALDIVSTPVDIVKDIAEGNKKTRTVKKLDKTIEDIMDIFD